MTDNFEYSGRIIALLERGLDSAGAVLVLTGIGLAQVAGRIMI